eukprot:TRINITY_DN10276_c0_g1_i2.p1 TRINITY_DN10276_c0_g1~~TRINITY_DN10276_c0_g1_i2.p1  ORF type:complete len:143 (-),score=23.31 TRINITY_DN10276_c0_g1_i2:118-489(-)
MCIRDRDKSLKKLSAKEVKYLVKRCSKLRADNYLLRKELKYARKIIQLLQDQCKKVQPPHIENILLSQTIATQNRRNVPFLNEIRPRKEIISQAYNMMSQNTAIPPSQSQSQTGRTTIFKQES